MCAAVASFLLLYKRSRRVPDSETARRHGCVRAYFLFADEGISRVTSHQLVSIVWLLILNRASVISTLKEADFYNSPLYC